MKDTQVKIIRIKNTNDIFYKAKAQAAKNKETLAEFVERAIENELKNCN